MHSPIRLHGVVLNWLSTGTALLYETIASNEQTVSMPSTSISPICSFNFCRNSFGFCCYLLKSRALSQAARNSLLKNTAVGTEGWRSTEPGHVAYSVTEHNTPLVAVPLFPGAITLLVLCKYTPSSP
jgi:hypothetical protein